jgi:putative nucleotidyltransferase with HDIG domain
MFLAPHWSTVAAIAACAAVKELSAHREILKKVFNVSQSALSAGLAILAFRLLGGKAFASASDFELVPYAAMYAVCLIANTLGVSIAVGLSQAQRISVVWRENTLSTAPYDLLAMPFVYGFASVYLTWGSMGALSLALPLIGVRQLYKTNFQLERINHELLELMVAAIEARDPYTSGHSRRVSRNARLIARAVGLSAKHVERVGVAALLHDVGKIHEIFAPILRKPDRLTAAERSIMETHPAKSAELVQNVSSLKDIVPAVKHHHENWDGSGYPQGLAGEEIPLFARVIMIADTVDAMTTDRPYRKAMTEDDVRNELRRMSGRQFDPRLCEVLLQGTRLADLLAGTSERATTRLRVTPARNLASVPQVKQA